MLQLHWSRPRRLASLLAAILLLTTIGLGGSGSQKPLWADEPAPAAAEKAAPEKAAEEKAAEERAALSQLRHRVDELIEAAAIGPLAPLCSDHDFVRRVSLDLTGVIPTPARVREFLADERVDKRERLIDELVSSPEFARHMAVLLDVALLERRTAKHIPVPSWEQYLFESIAADKPLDQLFRELIVGDRLGAETQPATKFLTSREAEPHAVTRGIGRLAFGMDLQCAQCHDHPLVDDYYQSDYHGLYAFLHRTSLLAAAKGNKLSERADGEANFTSVFTGDGRQWVLPQLPKGKTLLSEPTFAAGEEYTTKPDKTVAGVPKHSRREALAQLLGESRQFQRNVANRIWALVFGRGIVDPLDYHHTDNPPQNPALLNLLADQVRERRFDLRGMIRELVATRTYQRACDAPRPETVNFADIAARAERLAGRLEAALAAVEPLQKSAAAANEAWEQALTHNEAVAVQLPELQKGVTAAKEKHEQAVAAQKTAAETLARVQDQAAALAAAASQTEAAAAKLADDKELAAAAATVRSKSDAVAATVPAAMSAVSGAEAATAAAVKAVAEAEAAVAKAVESRVPAEKLAALEQARLAAVAQWTAAKHEHQAIATQLETCRTAAEYVSANESDPATAEARWQSLVEAWTIAGQIAPLKPLTPEQLAASGMRATGMLAPQIAAVEAKLDKAPPEPLKAAAEEAKPKLKAKLVQQELLNQLRGTVRQFVTHYGGLPGEDFQATVNQALFVGNSTLVAGWLNPAGDNLAQRLAASEDPAAVADELYVSVLSRHPKQDEKQAIAEVLADAGETRQERLGELIWALLSSTEFRFNH
ncbi:DUF1549 domain-containing protein [Candidatus Laterigemmans baculatus]|uniref:DUF1549 domain-containing protein n=1 Tax=Candidatus Laterigemmans baculatus TaxID=2770505 RepID=UPI0013DD5092|nr:DUF1549 domain-containing protein [Candidatus Laterigemmans baculatus]